MTWCVQVELIRRDYYANGGLETFLSYEDPEQDILVGLLRLRQASPQAFRWGVNSSDILTAASCQ